MILDQIFKSNESWNGEISQGACLLAATYCSFLQLAAACFKGKIPSSNILTKL